MDAPVAVEVVAGGLEVPWDLAFAPDGRIFVTERPGRIRMVAAGALVAEPWAELPVEAVGEAGLTAIALAPDFATSGAVLVLGTFRAEDGGLENRIVRLEERGGRGAAPRVLVGGLPADRLHAGSALEVGPDGLLYVTTGDTRTPRLAQDPGSLAGKLLRYHPDGRPAPRAGGEGPVLALGLRNSQGLAWHPSGALLASEHGPSGFADEGSRTGLDELNLLVPGGNYGWPDAAGPSASGDGRFVDPLATWSPAIAPSGLAVLTDPRFPEWHGHAFLGALRGQHLRRVGLELAGGTLRATGEEATLLEGSFGRIRAVVAAPDGTLHLTTSNRDGRGDPAPEDDRILRLVPAR